MKNKGNKIAIGSAVCFFLHPIIMSIWDIVWFGEIPWLFWLMYFSSAVLIVLRKNSVALIAVLSVCALLDILSYIGDSTIVEYLSLLSPISLVFLLLANKLPSLKNKANQINNLWFAPSTILLLFRVIPSLVANHFNIASTYVWADFCLTVGYLLLGLWVKRNANPNARIPAEKSDKIKPQEEICEPQFFESDVEQRTELELEESPAMDEDIISWVECHDGTMLTLYADVIVIDRSHSSQVTFGRGIEVNPQGKGTKSVPIRMIQSVEFQEAEEVLLGTKLGVLEFTMPGRDNGFTTSAVQARMYNLNRFQFLSQYNDSARVIKDYVEEYIIKQPVQSTTVIQQFSAADELKKFKELLDMGAITQEEFDAKKKQLLDL